MDWDLGTFGTFTRPTCADCAAEAPEIDSYYALIARPFSWRMTRHANGDASILVKWRCAPCWRTYKVAAEGRSGPA